MMAITKEQWYEADKMRLDGASYSKISLALGINQATIESHFRRIYSKAKLDDVQKELGINTGDFEKKDVIQTHVEKELKGHEDKIDKETIKQAAHVSIVCDKLLQACQIEKPIPIEKIALPKISKSSNTQPVLMFSDPQCGTKISAEATGGLNEYNKDTLKSQMKMLIDGIVSISIKQLSEHPLLKIHMLGDNLEGFGIFPGQAYHLDLDVYQQFFYLAELVYKFLVELLQLYDKIKIDCVPGNHGRIGNKGEAPAYLNWDVMWYKYMEQKMQNYKQITWNITDAWWILDTTYDTTSLLIHGDGIKSWNGIPFYGIQRADARYTKLMASNKKFYDIIEMGHFHTPSEIPTPTGPIMINGCFPGASMYALKDLNTSNRPLQKMFGIHKQHGLTWSFPVYLDY